MGRNTGESLLMSMDAFYITHEKRHRKV